MLAIPIYHYLLPTLLVSLPHLPSNFMSSSFSFIVINKPKSLCDPTCTWVCGHPLGCNLSVAISPKKMNPFHSSHQLPIAFLLKDKAEG